MEVKVMTTTFTTDQINAADTSQTITTFVTTPNIYIMQMFARVKTAFAGVTLPQVCLGVASHTERFMAKQPINAKGDLSTTVGTGNTAACKRTLSFQKTPGNIAIIATFSSSATNLASLSAGEIEFVCVYCE